MKNLNQLSHCITKFCFTALVVLITGNYISASTTVTFTNNTVTAIADDAYNGTLGSMAASSVTVAGIPAGAIITDIHVVASMNHTWVGDLVLKLKSPDLAVLGIASRPGFAEPADDGTGGAGLGDNLVSTSPVTFSDTGSYDAEVMGGIGDANNICQDDGQCSFFVNNGAIAAPPYNLVDLYSGTINGTWTFYAGDAGSGDVGDITSWSLVITYDIAPSNDDCSGAVAIGCSISSSVSGTTTGSTVDAVYSNCGAGGDNTTERGVWYVYAGDDKLVTITTCDVSGTGYDTRLTVYSGSCGAFTCVTANDDMYPDCSTGTYRSSVTFNAFSGTNYYVFVHGYQILNNQSVTGDFILNLSCAPLCTPVPGNDVCASAQNLTLGVTTGGSTVCSNSSPLLSNPSCIPAYVTPVDVWYKFTTGTGTAYKIILANLTSTTPRFTVYSGTCGSLSEIGVFCNTAGAYPVTLSPSTTYYIRVFNASSSDAGTFNISVNSFIPAANDDCSSVAPTTLTNGVPVTFTGSTVNASASPEEINLLGYAAVWEAVTLTGSCNNLTFDFCGTAAGVMAQGFVIYTDCPLTTTTAGSDNFTTCGDGNLTVNFYNLSAGTYYLPVVSDGVYNTLGTYTMHVVSEDCPGPPVNDNCASALSLPCGSSATGSTTLATLDGPATSCAGHPSAPDVWYNYAGTGQDFTVSLCGTGTDYDSQLDIYTGTCGALTPVDCNDDFCGNKSQVFIPSSSLGVTYYLRVHGFSGAVGNYEVSILDNPPTITCPATVNAGTDAGLCTASSVNLGSPTIGDDCGTATVTNNAPSVYPIGNTTVTWTATDAGGQTATCSQTVTVSDNENPVITCPANISVNAAAGLCVSAALSIGTATATDNCGVASISSNASGNTFPVGITTVTWTATDVHGNTSTCAQTITVTDTQLPAIICPATVSVSTDAGNCDATGVTLGTPTTADNCGIASVTNNAPPSYPKGNTTVTWTVTDVNGNSKTCTQTVTVTDNELPTITCPIDVSVSANAGSCFATGVTLGTPATSDNCSVASVTNNAPSSFPVGNTTVKWTVTDGSGNTATCSQTVTVTDDELPVINCTATVSVANSPGVCGKLKADLVAPPSSDNCGVATVTNDAPATLPIGTTTVIWTVTDVNGNTATCSQDITVNDAELPTITCPADVTVSADAGNCDATGVALGTPVTADNCGVASVTNNAPPSYPLGNTTVTWTVTDVNGNTRTCIQTVTVTDNELPTITCPTNVSVSANAGSCFATGVALGTPTTSDNCSVASVTNNAPSSFPVGNTIVKWTVTDGSGNTAICSQTVTVTDDELPVITCNASVTVSNSPGVCGALNVTLPSPPATDNCGIGSITNNAPATLPLGTTTVTWTVTDVNGNSATCTQNITVNDTEAPVLTCLGTVNVNTNPGACVATGVTIGILSATDNCGLSGLGNNAPSSYAVGTTTVTWTATDVHGNTGTCTQLVVVTDNELPTITCPSGVNVSADAGSCSATGVSLGTPSTSDNCGVASVTNNAPSSFPVGNTTVTWTVTDVHGNTQTCTQLVTVADDELPVINCTASITIGNDAGICGAASSSLTAPSATDNCGIATTTNNAPSTLPVGNTVVTWTITDVNGNAATCAQTITVDDTELPVITCPGNVSVSADAGNCDAASVVLGTPTTSDNCGVASVANNAPPSFPLGNTTVIWTVTDVNGNSATCSQTVTVTDDELPTITCPAAVSVGTDAGTCTATGVTLGTPVTADNCSVASVTNDAPSSFPVGSTTVTWTVTDGSGNSASCTQTMTVSDNELPVINCTSTLSLNNDAGVCGVASSSLTAPSATDNCGIASTTSNAPSLLPIGATIVTWTITDVNGNSATCVQTITVTDTELPTIVCPAAVAVNTDAGSCNATNVSLGTPTTADNCGVASVTNNAPSSYSVGNTTVTWTVTDVNGNSATCTQIVTVTDNELPVIACPPSVNANTSANSCTATGVNLGTPVTTDNCGVASVTNNAPSSYSVGNTTVVWTVTDANGNTATCSQAVIVADAQPPTIVCPANVTVNANSANCTATGVSLGTPTTADNCGVASTTNNAPSSFALGNTTVIWTVTDVHGNTATCAQTVTVNSAVDTSISVNGSTYTANATGATYQWYNCGTNSNIAGQTGASFIPQATGDYAVIVTQNGCKDTSACFHFVYVSVVNVLAENTFRVYPNPSNGQLFVEVSGSVAGTSHIQLLNLEGKLCRDITLQNMSGVQSVSLEGLASAAYLLRVTTESGVWNTKVFKTD